MRVPTSKQWNVGPAHSLKVIQERALVLDDPRIVREGQLQSCKQPSCGRRWFVCSLIKALSSPNGVSSVSPCASPATSNGCQGFGWCGERSFFPRTQFAGDVIEVENLYATINATTLAKISSVGRSDVWIIGLVEWRA